MLFDFQRELMRKLLSQATKGLLGLSPSLGKTRLFPFPHMTISPPQPEPPSGRLPGSVGERRVHRKGLIFDEIAIPSVQMLEELMEKKREALNTDGLRNRD